LSLSIVRFLFLLNFSEGFAEPNTEFAEISLILAVKFEFFRLSRLPELLYCGPRPRSAMNWLFQIFLRVVVSITLWTVKTPVKICLFIVSYVKDVKVIVFEVVFPSSFKAGLSRCWKTKSFHEESRNELNFADAFLLATSLKNLPIVTSPGIIFADVSIRSHADNCPSCSLIFLDCYVIERLILKLWRDLDQVQSVLFGKRNSRFITFVSIKACVFNHLIELL
jgi:hypothetical protein